MSQKNIRHEGSSDIAEISGEERRRQAESAATKSTTQTPAELGELATPEASRLLHELRVHQIELEMQNNELRYSQQELEISRALYFELYNLAPIGYLTLNQVGMIVGANFTFAAMMDVTLDMILDKPFTQFVFYDDQDIYYHWEKQLREKTELHTCELRLTKKDGTQFWIRLVANLSRDDKGNKVTRVVVSDISESKKAEHELAAANLTIKETSNAKSIFLANMSHELRTPLNTIIGFSEVMQDELFGPLTGKQKTFVENILNSGRHLLSLINDILDISKVEAQKMELELDHINLADICKGTVAAFSEKARKSEVTLSCLLDPNMQGVSVVADGRKIKQVLYNLVDNGIKFNHPQGAVSISVQKIGEIPDQSALQIVVEDTGIGIANDDQAKLFLPFSQLSQSYYDRQTEGTGLGLALTKHLVELHGGTIVLQSNPGKGSQFTVVLPLDQSKPNDV
jgi:PAS domain S-box-containing protein